MNRQEALREAAASLERHEVADAYAEAELLLTHSLGINRSQLYATLADPVPEGVAREYRGLVDRRAAGEPSAYITHRREFFGLEFYVDRRVLIPRPETELLVEKAIDESRRKHSGCPTIADIGAGSGAIAVALAVNLPDAVIYAVDISPEALEVAAINCEKHSVARRIKLLQGDLLGPLPGPVDLLLANLPYVKNEEHGWLQRHVRDHEPILALVGGVEGLDFIFKLLEQAPSRVSPGGAIILEIGAGQAAAVTTMARSIFPGAGIEILKDLASLDRAVVIEVTGVTP